MNAYGLRVKVLFQNLYIDLSSMPCTEILGYGFHTAILTHTRGFSHIIWSHLSKDLKNVFNKSLCYGLDLISLYFDSFNSIKKQIEKAIQNISTIGKNRVQKWNTERKSVECEAFLNVQNHGAEFLREDDLHSCQEDFQYSNFYRLFLELMNMH
jgi:hypothetical protein